MLTRENVFYMKMYWTSTVFILLLVLYSGLAQEDENINDDSITLRLNQESNNCRTPNGQRGRCVLLRQCPDLLSQTRTSEKELLFRLLRQSNCGFFQYEPRVCCAFSNSGETTSVQPTTSRNQGSSRPINLSSHPNKRLLPTNSCGTSLDDKLIGGKDVELEEFPWMTLLKYTFPNGGTSLSCGGALISDRYVLTAAHCVKGLPRGMKLTNVRLGEYDTTTDVDCKGSTCIPRPTEVGIEEIVAHEEYKPKLASQYHDIALLRLGRKITMSTYIQPICLPFDKLLGKNYIGKRLTVSGWGKTTNERGSESPRKQKLEIPVLPARDCIPFYRRNNVELQKTQICAGGERGRDSCQGDSGGPLMSSDVVNGGVRWHVTGIVSFGPTKCGTVKQPGIYTKVAEYVPWILDKIRE